MMLMMMMLMMMMMRMMMTIAESVVATEQQVGNWLADHFVEAGAQGCQLTASEIQPIIKKDR
eukprot:1256668-Karenia_brevis.AAC.1